MQVPSPAHFEFATNKESTGPKLYSRYTILTCKHGIFPMFARSDDLKEHHKTLRTSVKMVKYIVYYIGEICEAKIN
jgi:hypothetical protein